MQYMISYALHIHYYVFIHIVLSRQTTSCPPNTGILLCSWYSLQTFNRGWKQGKRQNGRGRVVPSLAEKSARASSKELYMINRTNSQGVE